jgi:hypothetical protein
MGAKTRDAHREAMSHGSIFRGFSRGDGLRIGPPALGALRHGALDSAKRAISSLRMNTTPGCFWA